jgi:hypothetical protein
LASNSILPLDFQDGIYILAAVGFAVSIILATEQGLTSTTIALNPPDALISHRSKFTIG